MDKEEEEEEMPEENERPPFLVKREEMDESYSEEGDSQDYRCYKRGPYKSYSISEKEKAVRLLVEDQLPITEISKLLGIPCKNIKRWSTEGVCRKRGGGRKRSSPLMENEVRKWIRNEFAYG